MNIIEKLDTHTHTAYVWEGHILSAKEPKCPLKGDLINKMWHAHIMKYHTAVKTN